MSIGVLLFHWQHVYEQGYVRGADKWKIREGERCSLLARWLQAKPERPSQALALAARSVLA